MGKIDFEKYPYLATIGGAPTLPDEGMEDLACKGWCAILTEMFDKINEVFATYGVEKSALNIIQIKEKFGALRMYYAADYCESGLSKDQMKSLDDQVDAIVEDAACRTEVTCCACGAPAEYFSTGWVLPYCGKCAHESHETANQRHKTNSDFDKSWRKITE